MTEDEKRLAASLNLAYGSLVESRPAAAELFAWLSTLPAGLEPPIAIAIFGPDTPYLVADLREYALVAPRQDRIELPPLLRQFAEHKLETAVPRERQLALLERTLSALTAFMTACYEHLGKPGTGAVIAASLREEANLAALVQRFEHLRAEAPDRSSLLAVGVRELAAPLDLNVAAHHFGRTLARLGAQQAHEARRAFAHKYLGQEHLQIEAALHQGGAQGTLDQAMLVARALRRRWALDNFSPRTAEAIWMSVSDNLRDDAADSHSHVYLFSRTDEAIWKSAFDKRVWRRRRVPGARERMLARELGLVVFDKRVVFANAYRALRWLCLIDAAANSHAAPSPFAASDLGDANTQRSLVDLFPRIDEAIWNPAFNKSARRTYHYRSHVALTAFTTLGHAKPQPTLIWGAAFDKRLADTAADSHTAHSPFTAFTAIDLGDATQRTLLDVHVRVGGGRMLTASILLKAAPHTSDDVGRTAAIFASQVARALRPPEALAELEQHLHQLFEARWQQDLPAGDDPLAPLPTTTDGPLKDPP